MRSTALVLCVLVAAEAWAAPPPVGSHWRYHGVLDLAVAGGGIGTDKPFTVDWFLAAADETGARLYWTVEENGRGRFPWTERFGLLDLDKNWRPLRDDALPAIVYQYTDGTGVVPVPAPFLSHEEGFAAGREWKVGQEIFSVEGLEKKGNTDCWLIEAQHPTGRHKLFWIEKKSPVAVAYASRVFLNMGTEYELQVRLESQEVWPAERTAQQAAAFDALLAVRGKVAPAERNLTVEWTPEQRTLLTAALPALPAPAQDGLLAKIVTAARQDLQDQTSRAGSVADLVKQFVGKRIEPFTARQLSGSDVKAQDLQGAVTVLHFWGYQGAPLEEPYGQVGYLDFLAHQRKSDNVRVYGIAVDERLGDDATRGLALRSIGNLKSFMNLSYPILLDNGNLLRQFGDPRRIGATLPLFVVLDAEGRILHYQVGFYRVVPDRGLSDLDAIVREAATKKS